MDTKKSELKSGCIRVNLCAFAVHITWRCDAGSRVSYRQGPDAKHIQTLGYPFLTLRRDRRLGQPPMTRRIAGSAVL